MNTFTNEELNTLKLAEVTEQYNIFAKATGDKPVKKFRDKPTAVKRTLEIQTRLPKPAPKITLTEKEHVAFNAIVQNGLDGMGGQEPANLLDDNFSWFDNADLIKLTKMSKHQCSGLIASLEEKGLIVDSEEGVNGEGPDQWFLSDEGINFAQSIKDEPVPKLKKAAKKPATGKKGNSKTDMTAKVTIAKARNNKEGSIGDCIFKAVEELNEPTVQELTDHMVATYRKPRSNVPVTPGFVVSTIRFFVNEGTLAFS